LPSPILIDVRANKRMSACATVADVGDSLTDFAYRCN
jgi:hypothetical protein